MTGASVGLPMRHQFQRPVLLSGVIADKFLNDGIPYIEVQQPGTAGRRGGRVGASVFVPISALSADDLAMLRLEIGQVVEVEGFSTSVPAGAQTVEVLVPLAFSAGDVRVEVPLDMAALMPGGTPAAQPMSVGSMPMMPAMMEMMG
ncbi:MAG: hypothetical protein HY335_10100, partial [Deinococcus sp.]|nr:hypothetical protein [Deinococcus sp.]